MHIDFDLLRRKRTIDPFAFAPVDIAETVAFTAEVLRDDIRANPDVTGEAGVGSCRVRVVSPTPRLRQRLAVLGWMPFDPASDDVWYIDQPVELRGNDNHAIASFVAQYYAEGMNLLFAPDDGMFSGGTFQVSPGAAASDGDLHAHMRLLAERAYVAQAVIVPRVPGSWFVRAVERAVTRDNAARARAGLPTITLPSGSTLGRWMREFRSPYWDRAGIGAEWRSYEGKDRSVPAPSTEQGRRSSRRTTAQGGARSKSTAAVGASAEATPESLTRAQRARSIVVKIQAAAAQDGRWERIDLGAGRAARVWMVDLGESVEAWLTTRFSGVSNACDASGTEEGLDVQMVPLPADDMVIDLFVEGAGKVLSVRTRDDADRVISMTPGPWEARFGLPARPWSPAVQRRLRRSA